MHLRARCSLVAELHHPALGKHQEKCQVSWSSSQGCASCPGIWGEQDFLSLLLAAQVQHTACFAAKGVSTLAPSAPVKLHFKSETKDWRSNCRRADTHNCEQIERVPFIWSTSEFLATEEPNAKPFQKP